MNFLINMVKGSIIGIANVIPGLSGGTKELTMNL